MPSSTSNSSVETGYRAGQEPQSILQKNQAMTDKSKRIYGHTLHATPLLGKIDKKGLMKNPPVTLMTETESITFLQGFHNHCQSHGVFVPALGEIEKNNVMGTAWAGIGQSHGRKDEMATALNAVLHLLCKDDKIHKRYHQAIHDGLGDGYIALYNLCRTLKLPCLGDENLMASDIPKQKATEYFSLYIARVSKHLMEEQMRKNEISNDKALHLVKEGLHPTCKRALIRLVNDIHRPTSKEDIPWCLYFSQLAITLEQLARENDIEIPGNSAKDGKSGVYEVDEFSDSDDEEFFYDDQDDDVNEVGDAGCGFCGANHETDECIKVINYAIMTKVLKFTPAKLEDILKKELVKQGKTRVTDLKLRGFRPKNGTRDRDSRKSKPNDRNRNGRPNDRRRNDGFQRRKNDRVNEIEDVEASPPVEKEAPASEDVPQAPAVEDPAEPPPPITDTCNAVDHMGDEDTEDDESSFSSEDSFDDELCLVSSGVFHVSEITTVEDVEDGDEESDDEASMDSLVEETKRSLNILEQPQVKYPEFSPTSTPGHPLGTVFENKRVKRIRREGVRPRYKLKTPPPTSWLLDVKRASEFSEVDGPMEKQPLTDQMLGNC